MNLVNVYQVGADPGDCKVLYRTVPHKQLVCTLEEGIDATDKIFTWFTCCDDNTWNEPDHPIDMNKFNIKVISEKEAKKLIKEHHKQIELWEIEKLKEFKEQYINESKTN